MHPDCNCSKYPFSEINCILKFQGGFFFRKLNVQWKTFHIGLWLTSVVLLFKLISCGQFTFNRLDRKELQEMSRFERPASFLCHLVSGRLVIPYHGKKFLLSLCQELLITNFLDVMGRTVKREYYTSLPCIQKALISHNHKQDFIC